MVMGQLTATGLLVLHEFKLANHAYTQNQRVNKLGSSPDLELGLEVPNKI